MTKRSNTDWAAVEADFRAGKLSNRQIAKKFGVSESSIRKHADAGGWVRTKAQGAHHAPAVRPAPPREPRSGPSDPVDLGQDLALRLLGELDDATSHLDQIEDAIHEETQGDQNGRRRQMMLQAVSLGSRSLTLKTLAQALAVLKEVSQGAAKGKKEQQADAAKKAGAGKFAPPAPPKLAVDNTR